MSDFLDLAPIKRVAGTVKLPGSKSISNRMLLLAALAQGVTVLRDVLDADDTRVMIEGLRKLGVHIEGNTDALHVQGIEGAFPVKHAELFLGNAGTAFRPLTAALALSGGDYKLSGVARMHERPIKDLVDALAQLGARITYLQNAGYPPLHIEPALLQERQHVSIRGDVSSQFLTALLMAAPLTGRTVVIAVEGELISRPYIAITLNAMHRFGIDVAGDHNTYTVPAGVYSSPGELHVEGDASAASYFLAAGAISGLHNAGSVKVEGVGRASVQGDVRFADALEKMGAQIEWNDHSFSATAGAEVKRMGKFKAFDMDFNHIPDAAMTAAICALFADGVCTLRNIGSWRVKETDRIAAMATELRKVGATVEEGADWLKITPPKKLTPNAAIDTYDDHRMAMCFSLVALGGVPVRINHPECVAKTYPDYFKVFESISQR